MSVCLAQMVSSVYFQFRSLNNALMVVLIELSQSKCHVSNNLYRGWMTRDRVGKRAVLRFYLESKLIETKEKTFSSPSHSVFETDRQVAIDSHPLERNEGTDGRLIGMPLMSFWVLLALPPVIGTFNSEQNWSNKRRNRQESIITDADLDYLEYISIT